MTAIDVRGLRKRYGDRTAVDGVDWMVDVASLFPLKWTAQGMRSVFLPDGMMTREEAGTWEHLTTALVLGAWCVAGLLLCRVTFRWTNRDRR